MARAKGTPQYGGAKGARWSKTGLPHHCPNHNKRENGCAECRRLNTAYNHALRHLDLKRYSTIQTASKVRLKLAVIAKLGGKCVACGMTDPRVLQVNHKNGGGLKELKRIGSTHIYRGIVLGTRTTDDVDLRCANCNIIYEYERGARRWIDDGRTYRQSR